MPVFNRHAFLREAIDSIMQQTMTDFELIIVNDGSTSDSVLRILAETVSNDRRVRVLHQNNHGPAAARNAGAEASAAPLIALMDDDDISHPDRLKKQAHFLDENKQSQSVSVAMGLIDRNGKFIQKTPTGSAFLTTKPTVAIAEALALVESHTLNATAMMRREAFEEIGGYRAWFRQSEDADLTLRFMEKHSLSLIPEPLYYYRAYSSGSRISQGGKPWDYYAAAIISFCARQSGKPDPIPQRLDDILCNLGMLPDVARSCLLWRARGSLRRAIRDGDKSRFKELWTNCRRLSRSSGDRKMLNRMRKKTLFLRARYFRLWKINETDNLQFK